MPRQMKDSGVEWIGNIPEKWDVRKLKYISEFRQDKYNDTYENIDYLGLENIESWSGKYIKTESEYDKSQSIVFQSGDILWGKLRPYLAKVYHCPNKGCCSSEFCVIRFANNNSHRYYWNLLISPNFVSEIDRSTYGTKMPRANADFIKNMLVPMPPVDEQDRIAYYLDKQCSYIDSVLEQTRSSIEEYKRLKKAVITQAVTKGVQGNRLMKDSNVEWLGNIPAGWNVYRIANL